MADDTTDYSGGDTNTLDSSTDPTQTDPTMADPTQGLIANGDGSYTDPNTGAWYGPDGSSFDPSTGMYVDGNTGQTYSYDPNTGQPIDQNGNPAPGNIAQKIMSAMGQLGKTGALGKIGAAIGGANATAAQGRLDTAKLGLQANQQNISGMSASENALMQRAQLEQQQRQTALQNAGRANYVGQGGFQSPFAPKRTPFGSQYMQQMAGVGKQARDTLAAPVQYGSSQLPAFQPYQPVPINNIPGATGTTPSGLSDVGNYVGPGLSILGALAGGPQQRLPQAGNPQNPGGPQ
jgi:hypothetical protein